MTYSLVLNSVTETFTKASKAQYRTQARKMCSVYESLPHLGGWVWVGSWSPSVWGPVGTFSRSLPLALGRFTLLLSHLLPAPHSPHPMWQPPLRDM